VRHMHYVPNTVVLRAHVLVQYTCITRALESSHLVQNKYGINTLLVMEQEPGRGDMESTGRSHSRFPRSSLPIVSHHIQCPDIRLCIPPVLNRGRESP